MVHSVELLLDRHTETAIRQVWENLSDAGLRSPAPTSRPHVTLVVADRISSDVDSALRPVLNRFPFECVAGAPMVLGRSPLILVRQVVPSAELLALHAEVLKICRPFLDPGPAPNTLVGQWTPHVTLARRVGPSQFVSVINKRGVTREITGTAVGLRHWDGNKRVEYVIA
jgi:2'-5' RNA ligase